MGDVAYLEEFAYDPELDLETIEDPVQRKVLSEILRQLRDMRGELVGVHQSVQNHRKMSQKELGELRSTLADVDMRVEGLEHQLKAEKDGNCPHGNALEHMVRSLDGRLNDLEEMLDNDENFDDEEDEPEDDGE